MSATRKNIMLGTAGHVDHGKTALVKLFTGCDTDRLAEEKRRGLTIELGFAPCRLADERIVGVVDVPGHVDFIRHMAAGAHGVDVVILVIAADDGVMPQTREHLDILTLMGVRRGLIAVTKIDLVDAARRAAVEAEVRSFVRGTFLAEAPIRGISNMTGEGFDAFFDALNEQVDACRPRESFGPFRMWIERSFHVRGFGTVVSGIPASGEVRVGDRLALRPGDVDGRVRNVQVYGADAEVGRCGECVALNVSDVEPHELQRGKALCSPGYYPIAGTVEADLKLLPSVPGPLADYAEAHVHIGTAEVMGSVVLLEGKPLAPGNHQLVQLRLREPVCAAPGEPFVLRASLAGLAGGRVTTVGGGRLLDASDRKQRRGKAWVIEPLSARRNALDDPVRWCDVVLAQAGGPMNAHDWARAAGVTEQALQAAVDVLIGEGQVLAHRAGGYVHTDVFAAVERNLLGALREFHQRQPDRAGMSEAELLNVVDADRRRADLVKPALERLLRAGCVERRGAVLALPGMGALRETASGHSDVFGETACDPSDASGETPCGFANTALPSTSRSTNRLSDRVLAALRKAPLTPPSSGELAQTLNVTDRQLGVALQDLIDAGLAVRLGSLVFCAEAVEHATEVALSLFDRGNTFTTMDFRDALGVSRKFAVPMLDHLDAIRITTRTGNLRRPGAEGKKRLESR